LTSSDSPGTGIHLPLQLLVHQLRDLADQRLRLICREAEPACEEFAGERRSGTHHCELVLEGER
jgi:hypothetical protein